jgi:hypothetical protein
MCVRQKLRSTVPIDKSHDTLGVLGMAVVVPTATGTQFYCQFLLRMCVQMLTRQRTGTIFGAKRSGADVVIILGCIKRNDVWNYKTSNFFVGLYPYGFIYQCYF